MKNLSWKKLWIISICVMVGIITFLILDDFKSIHNAKDRVLKAQWAIFQKASKRHKNTDEDVKYNDQISHSKETSQENSTAVDEYDKRYINSLYSIDEMKQAYIFAERVKLSVKAKNINSFVDYVSFPVTINSTNTNLQLNNKAEFVKLDTDKLFTDNFVQEICKDEDLFVSYKGFMMGNEPNLFFDFNENGVLRIYALNI